MESPPKKPRFSDHIRKNAEDQDQDYISALPDPLIHVVMSHLPLKDSVKTSELSKRWKNVWTAVPNLEFHFQADFETGRFSYYSGIVNRTLKLYSSQKVKKFALDIVSHYEYDSGEDLWVRFAMDHDVEEFFLHFIGVEDENFDDLVNNLADHETSPNFSFYTLPQFIYDYSSVSKLSFKFCNFSPRRQVSWTLLKVLSIAYVHLTDDVMQRILLGTPALESLELFRFEGINRLNITSNRLVKLVLNDIWDTSRGADESALEISAPNLLSLSILGYLCRRICRLVNVSSLVDAKFDFVRKVNKGEDIINFYKEHQNMVNELLEQVRHVRELALGSWCIQVVSIREVIRLPSPLSKCKCITLDMHCNEWDMPGVASLLHSSPEMEKLVINVASSRKKKQFGFDRDFKKSYCFAKNYWTSQKRIFKCLFLHLETIEIVGLESRTNSYDRELALLEFLLENAKVLKKLFLIEEDNHDRKKHYLLEVAQKLSSFPWCSPHAIEICPPLPFV